MHIEPGTIFYRPRPRPGREPLPIFRVAGCRCGKAGGCIDHRRLREAEHCSQQVKENAA